MYKDSLDSEAWTWVICLLILLVVATSAVCTRDKLNTCIKPNAIEVLAEVSCDIENLGQLLIENQTDGL